MNATYPTVSVVMPVKNEAAKIKACIEGILMQSVPVKEIIVVDSGSTDGTLEILADFPQVKVYEIPPTEFNHGDTRNFGVSKATGEFVLLTVGDARAYDEFWIQHLLNGFDAPEVAGVCGQQVVPHDFDKNPMQWFRPLDAPKKIKYAFTKEEFAALPPQQRKWACGWDDVTAMYRREVLQEIPFQRTSYCEDALWAKEALLAGYTLVYNFAARVYHYHLENSDFTFKVSLTARYFAYRNLQYLYPEPVLSLRQRLSMMKTISLAEGLSSAKKWRWLKYNLAHHEAERKAHQAFVEALKQGESTLDKVHEKFCGKPPIPLKAKKHEPALG